MRCFVLLVRNLIWVLTKNILQECRSKTSGSSVPYDYKKGANKGKPNTRENNLLNNKLMQTIKQLFNMIGVLSLFLFSACNNASNPKSDQEIENWANAYCRIASGFMQDFMGSGIQPQGGWEASYAFVQHYQRTIEAAKNSVNQLRPMQVPGEAQSLHHTTISAMEEIQRIASDAVADVNNATNRVLFQSAIDLYANRAIQQSKRIEDATNQTSTGIREKLQNCTLQMVN